VQIDLRAGDAAMSQQIPDCHQLHVGLHKVRGERVPVMPSSA
jgi:hypothetical protein